MAQKKVNKKDSFAERKRRVAAQYAKQYPCFNLISNFFGVLLFVSIFLAIWGLTIYDRTYMPVSIPVMICVAADFISTPLLRKTLNIYIVNANNPVHLPLPFHVFYNVVTWDGLVFFLFVFTNETFSSHRPFNVSTNIVSRGYSKNKGGYLIPYVTIHYKNKTKELNFESGTKVEGFKTVSLQMEKGFWGYDIIENYSLVTDY